MSLLSALETKEPAARVPPSQGWAPDPAPPPPPGTAPDVPPISTKNKGLLASPLRLQLKSYDQ